MKLYIWNEVLCDYTCGVMFAIADSVEEARELIFNKYMDNQVHFKNHIESIRKTFECYTKEPDEVIDINSKYAFYLWGGG